jgi:hypothetical protein
MSSVVFNVVALIVASNVVEPNVVPMLLVALIAHFGTIPTPSPKNINLINIDAQVKETSVDMM